MKNLSRIYYFTIIWFGIVLSISSVFLFFSINAFNLDNEAAKNLCSRIRQEDFSINCIEYHPNSPVLIRFNIIKNSDVNMYYLPNEPLMLALKNSPAVSSETSLQRNTELYPAIIIFFIGGLIIFLAGMNYFPKNNSNKIEQYRVLKIFQITDFLFSPKTQKEIFEPLLADWQEEYFEALFKEKIWKSRWINFRYICAFLATLWMKSPIGDLIEFIQKLAK